MDKRKYLVRTAIVISVLILITLFFPMTPLLAADQVIRFQAQHSQKRSELTKPSADFNSPSFILFPHKGEFTALQAEFNRPSFILNPDKGEFSKPSFAVVSDKKEFTKLSAEFNKPSANFNKPTADFKKPSADFGKPSFSLSTKGLLKSRKNP